MLSYIVTFLAGAAIGCTAGVLAMAALVAGRRADDRTSRPD